MTTHTKPKAESQIFTDEQMKIINSIKLPKASDKVSFDTTKPKAEKKECEAVYGNVKCQNIATSPVISSGELFSLCPDCAKNARLQIKLNK